MDSSSGPPTHGHLQPPPTAAHHGVLMIPHSLTPQHYSSNNSYALLPNSNNSTTLMHHQNPRVPFADMPLDHHYSDGSHTGEGGAWLGMEPAKKKRGRPRKYSPDNSIGLGLSPIRNRGRPPGSGKRQLNALGVAGVGFTPHVIMVDSGEDIISKILAFSQQGPRIVFILSATGAVCDVALLRTAMPTDTPVTYEGRFDIISLSGSFVSSECDDMSLNQSGLSVSLAGSDGRILGGGVGEILKAASPVQIIVGSFMTQGKKTKPSTTTPTSSSHPNLEAVSHSSSTGEEDNEEDGTWGTWPCIPSTTP